MAVPNLQDALDRLQQDDVDAAISTLEQKVDELPAHLTAHVLLAQAHEAKHQWEKAFEYWENAYFLMPNSPVARAGKRRVLRRIARAEEADREEADPSPTSADASHDGAGEEASPSAIDPPSEFEQLRRRAEEEARTGGARPELADRPEARSATPEERIDEIEDESEDLDRLIDELESAHIEPTPDMDEAPTPDLENDVDDLVSETLARIHEAQDRYRKAAQIYVKLASQEPDRARAHLEKAAEMRQQAEQHTQDDNA